MQLSISVDREVKENMRLMERVHVVDVSKRKLEKKYAPAISNKPLDTDPCCEVSMVAKIKLFGAKKWSCCHLKCNPITLIS